MRLVPYREEILCAIFLDNAMQICYTKGVNRKESDNVNRKYLQKLFTLIHSDDKVEFELKNANDLEEYIEMVIKSNMQYDFDIDIDIKELLK